MKYEKVIYNTGYKVILMNGKTFSKGKYSVVLTGTNKLTKEIYYLPLETFLMSSIVEFDTEMRGIASSGRHQFELDNIHILISKVEK